MKNRIIKYFRFVFFILLTVSIFNCSSNNKINEETLAKVYVDKLIVEEQYQKNDSLETKINGVFKKYSITKEDYKNEIKKIGYDKEHWEKFFTFSQNYLDTLKSELDKKNKISKKIKTKLK